MIFDKAVGTLSFTNEVLAEIKLFGNSLAILGGGDGIYNLTFFVMDNTVRSSNVLGCGDFELRTFEISFLEYGDISRDLGRLGFFLCRLNRIGRLCFLCGGGCFLYCFSFCFSRRLCFLDRLCYDFLINSSENITEFEDGDCTLFRLVVLFNSNNSFLPSTVKSMGLLSRT